MSAIFKQMVKVMSEIKSVGKNNTNTQQGYKFRGIDDMINALYPCLVKHEVFMTPKVVKEDREVREVHRSNGKVGYDKHVHLQVEYTFHAVDGSSITIGPITSEGLDSGDKATNKALSAALKYALIQTFAIPTEDMEEADNTSPEISATENTPDPVKAVASSPQNLRPKGAFKPTVKTENKPEGDLI